MTQSIYHVYDISNPFLIHLTGSLKECSLKVHELAKGWELSNYSVFDFIIEDEYVQQTPNKYDYAK